MYARMYVRNERKCVRRCATEKEASRKSNANTKEYSDCVVLTYISLSQTTEYILPNSIGIALHNFLHARSSFLFLSFSPFLFFSFFFSFYLHVSVSLASYKLLSNRKFFINIKHVYKHRLITSVFTIIYD